MGKLFNLIDWFSAVFDWFSNFIKISWQIITTVFSVAASVFADCPSVIYAFFSIFMVLAIAMFVWRLIP